MREPVEEKAGRLLTEGRVHVRHRDEVQIAAVVEGDTGRWVVACDPRAAGPAAARPSALARTLKPSDAPPRRLRHERGLPLLEQLAGIRPGLADDVPGPPLADIRIYVENGEGEEIPTKKGISVKVELPQLLEAVRALVEAA